MSGELEGAAQALVVIERITRETRDLFLRLLGPVAEAAGELIADKINARRTANLERLAERVTHHLRESGHEPHPVELTILVPVLQQASLEDRDDLVAAWAGLLASAASGNEVHTSYPKILSEITPAEARLLDVLYRWTTTGEDEDDRDLIKHAQLSTAGLSVIGVNLGLRHGLINGVHTSLWKPDLTKWSNIRLTPLGLDLVSVCRGPKAQR
jgi:hypothetical protein